MVGEIGLQLLAAAHDALLKAFYETAFLEVAQHQVFDVVPKAILHHIVDAFVAKDGELMILDGEVDEYAVVQLGFIEFQVLEDDKAALFHIASTAILDMHFDLARGVELGLLDGLHDATVFLTVQYGDGVRHDVFL